MANNSGYTGSQVLSMQKDAVRRVNEMQRQARERVRQSAGGGSPQPTSPPRAPGPGAGPPSPIAPIAPTAPIAQPVIELAAQAAPNPFQGMLQRLGFDQETVTLLVLLLLLVNEGSDTMLILALVYLLL